MSKLECLASTTKHIKSQEDKQNVRNEKRNKELSIVTLNVRTLRSDEREIEFTTP